MPYSVATTSRNYAEVQQRRFAVQLGDTNKAVLPGTLSYDVDSMARQLILDLPGFDWTIEVDLLGHHRITIHFKGLGVQMDE